jgi:hypothetical protein
MLVAAFAVHPTASVIVTEYEPTKRPPIVCVVAPVFQRYVNGWLLMTDDGTAVALPVAPPKQVTCTGLMLAVKSQVGGLTVPDAVVVQPLASVTVTDMFPEHRFVTDWVV